MEITEILELWSEDTNIDSSELTVESLKIPKLHHKYLKLFMSAKKELAQFEVIYKQALKIKTEYYQGILPEEELKSYKLSPFPLKILKENFPLYLESDEQLAKLRLKFSEYKEKVDLLDAIIKSINNRNFNIKNAIDFLKWSNGS